MNAMSMLALHSSLSASHAPATTDPCAGRRRKDYERTKQQVEALRHDRRIEREIARDLRRAPVLYNRKACTPSKASIKRFYRFVLIATGLGTIMDERAGRPFAIRVKGFVVICRIYKRVA